MPSWQDHYYSKKWNPTKELTTWSMVVVPKYSHLYQKYPKMIGKGGGFPDVSCAFPVLRCYYIFICVPFGEDLKITLCKRRLKRSNQPCLAMFKGAHNIANPVLFDWLWLIRLKHPLSGISFNLTKASASGMLCSFISLQYMHGIRVWCFCVSVTESKKLHVGSLPV